MKENNVVIIDDEQFVLNCLKRALNNEPYGVFTTKSRQEALQMIADNPVKVVISDHRMPEVSGTDFLNTVKQKYPNPIRILLTGYTDVKIAEEAINKGEVFRFVKKPWDDENLRKVIKEAIDKFDSEETDRRILGK